MVRKREPQVKQEDGLYWLSPARTAAAAGLSKPELARRIGEFGLRVQYGAYGAPTWYAEPEIHELRKARNERIGKRSAKQRRQKTAEQQERDWAKASEANRERYRGGGPVSAHYDKVILADIVHRAEEEKRGG